MSACLAITLATAASTPGGEHAALGRGHATEALVTGEHAALEALLHATEALVTDFSGDHRPSLTPLVVAAAAEQAARHPAQAPFFQALLQSCSWDSGAASFRRPLEARALCSRLKAFLLEGLQQAGAGSYSVVYRARSKLGGPAVALKKLRLEGAGEEGMPSTAVREVSLLRELAACPNVVR